MDETKLSVSFGVEFFRDEDVRAFVLRAPNGQIYSVASDFVGFRENLVTLIAGLEQVYADRRKSSAVVEKV